MTNSNYDAPFQYNNNYRTDAVPPEISIVILNPSEKTIQNNLDNKNYTTIGDFKQIDIGVNGENKFDFVVYKNKITKRARKADVKERGYVIIKKTNGKDIVFDLDENISRYNNSLDNPFNIYYILTKIIGEEQKYSSNFNRIIKSNKYSNRILPQGKRETIIGNDPKEIEMEELQPKGGMYGDTFYKYLYKLLEDGKDYENNCFFFLGASRKNSNNKLFEGITGYYYFIKAKFSGVFTTDVYFPAIIRVSSDILKFMLNQNIKMLKNLKLGSDPIFRNYLKNHYSMLEEINYYDDKKISRIIRENIKLTDEEIEMHNLLLRIYSRGANFRYEQSLNKETLQSLKDKFFKLNPSKKDKIYEEVKKIKDFYKKILDDIAEGPPPTYSR